MQLTVLALLLLALSALGYRFGLRRSVSSVPDERRLHSRPTYYGVYVALWCGIPAVIMVALWLVLQPVLVEQIVLASLPQDMQALSSGRLALLVNDIQNLAAGDAVSREVDPVMRAAADRLVSLQQTGRMAMVVVVLAVAILGLTWGWRNVGPELRARNRVEGIVRVILIAASTVAILTTLGIVLSLLFEAIRFFGKVSFHEFLFGLKWSPQIALREDQVGSSGLFGAIPLFAGTLLITLIAMLVAAPVGLLSAIYMSEYAPRRVRGAVKPLLEILAGIPTVVYGFFAALTVAPFLRNLGGDMGLDVSSESALAAGGVMGIMIIPFVSSLSDDVINAVPQSMRDGAFALGATKAETIKQVIIPEKNKKDLYDIPKNVKSRLKFTIVRDVNQVLEIALEPAPDEPDTPESDGPETRQGGPV